MEATLYRATRSRFPKCVLEDAKAILFETSFTLIDWDQNMGSCKIFFTMEATSSVSTSKR